jgi:hypothetical protein
MTLALVKERLHDYIEQADATKVQAIYTLIEGEIDNSMPVYDEETITYFEHLRKQFIDSKHPGFTVEESMANIRQRLKKNGL